jgi:hypothetical protein
MLGSDLISILGSIVQAYASLLGIVGMYLVFLRQRRADYMRDIKTRLRTKSETLVGFINREISPAYKDSPIIRVDFENFEEVIRAIDNYRSERTKEIPDLSTDDVKRLITLWSIEQKEKEELIQLKNQLEQNQKPVFSNLSFIIFAVYFLFELGFALLSFFVVLSGLEYQYQFFVTQLTLLLAILGLLPLGYLFYDIR